VDATEPQEKEAGLPAIRVLVDACLAGRRADKPDLDTELVVADWCEEHGLLGIANAVRMTDGNMRWSALAHLWRCIEPTFWTSSSPAPTKPAAKAKATSRRRKGA